MLWRGMCSACTGWIGLREATPRGVGSGDWLKWAGWGKT